MQEAAIKEEEGVLSVPDGGIAGLVMDDDEIAAAYGPDEAAYTDDGIAQFPALAQKMAAMGRNGDDMVAHVERGELIIPRALIEQDPAIKEGIFARLRDMGIEDPERYVVGSESNSLNPETGMPEFFLKKVFRGIKKAVKGVIKVVKKVAKVVLPIVGTMVFGPVWGAALGSGIATLINGGSFKDALKSAAFAGLTGGAMSFAGGTVSGLMSGQGLGASLQAGMSNLGAAASLGNLGAGFQSIGNAFQGDFSGISTSNMAAGPNAPGGTAYQATVDPTISGQGAASTVTDAALEGSGVSASGTPTGATNAGLPTGTNAPVNTAQVAAQDVVAPVRGPSFGESIKDAFTPGGRSFTQSMGDAFFPRSTMAVPETSASSLAGQTLTNPSTAQILQANNINPLQATTAQMTAAQNLASQAAPSMLRSYGPLAAAGLAAASATGMFEPVPAEPAGVVERDEQGNVITGADLIEQDPGRYLVGDLGNVVLDPETGQYVPRAESNYPPIYTPPTTVPTTSPYQPVAAMNMPNSPYLMGSNPTGPFARPYVTAAEGGAIFPRRNGGIMPDEGVPGQDSVRAMLMPGEFVMTTDAVRGMGNGDVRKGIQNMYSVMRNLEARGRATA